MSISPLNQASYVENFSSVEFSNIPSPELQPTKIDGAWNSNATEELSMQFSEIMESQQQTLDERIEKSVLPSDEEPTIKEIEAVMKLLEGQQGFQAIRNRAHEFAKSYFENPEQAKEMLLMSTLSPEQKYAALRLALEGMQPTNATTSVDSLDASLVALGSKHDAEAFTQTLNSIRNTHLIETNNDSKLREEYFQLLASLPSIKSIWGLATDRVAVDDLMSTLSQMQRLGNELIPASTLELIGKTFMINRLVQAIRTLMMHAKYLLNQMDPLETPTPNLVQQLTSHLIDLAHSTVSSSLIEKMTSAVTSQPHHCIRRKTLRTCICTDKSKFACLNSDVKPYIYSMLYRTVHRWPEEFWGSQEIRKGVMDQLVRKQGIKQMPQGREI